MAVVAIGKSRCYYLCSEGDIIVSKRQHTIPQFYLRPFLSPGWVYRCGKFTPRATKNPAGVAVKKNYYGKGESGRKTLDNLNSLAETYGAPVLKKLFENPYAIMWKDYVELSYLFANFFVRTPSIIEETRAMELEMTMQVMVMARKMTERLAQSLLNGSDVSEFLQAEPDNESASMTLDQMIEHTSKLQQKGGHRVAALDTFYSLVDIAECIQQMSFRLVEAPDHLFFVTSDNPLTLQRRTTGSRVGAGWKNNDALGLIPLCPSHLLLMFYGRTTGIGIQQATPEQVVGLNLETIRFADQEVYSPFKYQEADDWMKAAGRWHPSG